MGYCCPRPHVTPIPVTHNVIDHVYAMADYQHMPCDLKIQIYTGDILCDSASVAGVDYQHDGDVQAINDIQHTPNNDNDNKLAPD